VNAVSIGDGIFSQSGIFFLPEERRVVAVFPHGATLPLKVDPGAGRRFGAGIAKRVTGAKWTFRKGPFFSREHRR